MKCNIRPAERSIRVVGGSVLTVLAIWTGNPWLYLGVVPLITGLVGWCPPYALLGINKSIEV